LCDKFKKQPIHLIFETLNSALSLELKTTKVGEITFPVKADVYQKKWDEY